MVVSSFYRQNKCDVILLGRIVVFIPQNKNTYLSQILNNTRPAPTRFYDC